MFTYSSTKNTNDIESLAKTPKIFSDFELAFKYMWDKSFSEGKKYGREVSAWVLMSGEVLVLPYYKNVVDVSRNDLLPLNYNGDKSEVISGNTVVSSSRMNPLTPCFFIE